MRSGAAGRSLGLAGLLAALGATACGPILMLPGGQLAGDVRPAPRDWSFSDDVDVVQLETRPDDPYSVNVWGVAQGEAFYVTAGRRDSRWVGHIAGDPRVRLKVCEDVYEMTAVEITDEEARESLIAAIATKYDFTPSARQRAEGTVFRLDPR